MLYKKLCLFQTCFSSKPLLVAAPKLYSNRNFETRGHGNAASLIIYCNTNNTAMPDGDTKFCKETRHSAAFSEHSHLHYHHAELSPAPPFPFPRHSLPDSSQQQRLWDAGTQELVLTIPRRSSPLAVRPRSRSVPSPAGALGGRLLPAPSQPKHWFSSSGVLSPLHHCPRTRWGPYHPQPAHPRERRGEETAPLTFISRG